MLKFFVQVTYYLHTKTEDSKVFTKRARVKVPALDYADAVDIAHALSALSSSPVRQRHCDVAVNFYVSGFGSMSVPIDSLPQVMSDLNWVLMHIEKEKDKAANESSNDYDV